MDRGGTSCSKDTFYCNNIQRLQMLFFTSLLPINIAFEPNKNFHLTGLNEMQLTPPVLGQCFRNKAPSAKKCFSILNHP